MKTTLLGTPAWVVEDMNMKPGAPRGAFMRALVLTGISFPVVLLLLAVTRLIVTFAPLLLAVTLILVMAWLSKDKHHPLVA